MAPKTWNSLIRRALLHKGFAKFNWILKTKLFEQGKVCHKKNLSKMSSLKNKQTMNFANILYYILLQWVKYLGDDWKPKLACKAYTFLEAVLFGKIWAVEVVLAIMRLWGVEPNFVLCSHSKWNIPVLDTHSVKQNYHK